MTSKRRAVVGGVAALALTLTGTSPALGQSGSSAGPETPIVGDADTGPAVREAADRRRAPVKVGLIEQVEGAFVMPEFGIAAEAMVDYFNTERGGIGGHPMQLEVCDTDDTAASARACAERFADADDVHLVIESTTNPSAIADVLVPAGKPLLAGGVDMTAMLREGVFVMEPGGGGIAQALFSYAASEVGVTHLTVFHADDPSLAGMIPVLDLIAADAGIVVDAYVPLGFSGDLSGPISAGLSEESDGLAFVVAPNQCAPVGEALETVGNDLPVVVAELCLIDDVISSGVADGWYAGTQSLAPVANGRGETLEIRRILRRYGESTERGGFAGLGIGYAWIAHDVLGQAGAGRATDESVMRTLEGYSSDDVLGFDEVSCPGPGSFIAACNVSTLMTQVRDGQLYDVGGFVESDFSIFEALLG